MEANTEKFIKESIAKLFDGTDAFQEFKEEWACTIDNAYTYYVGWYEEVTPCEGCKQAAREFRDDPHRPTMSLREFSKDSRTRCFECNELIKAELFRGVQRA